MIKAKYSVGIARRQHSSQECRTVERKCANGVRCRKRTLEDGQRTGQKMVGLGPFEVFCQWRHSAPGAMVSIRLSPTNFIPLLTFGD